MKSLLTILSAAVCLVLVPLGRAGEDQTVNVAVPKGDKVAVHIPAAWKATVIQPTPDLPPTITVNDAAQAFSFQLTFIPDPEGRFTTKDTVDRAVTIANQQYVAGSVEKRLSLIQLDSRTGHGCYSTFTDADLVGVETPTAGQFRYVLSGVFVVGRQAAVFTFLTNNNASPAYRQAIETVSAGITVQ